MGKKTSTSTRPKPYPDTTPGRRSIRQVLITSRQEAETVLNENGNVVQSDDPCPGNNTGEIPSDVNVGASTSADESTHAILPIDMPVLGEVQVPLQENMPEQPVTQPSMQQFQEMQQAVASISTVLTKLQSTVDKLANNNRPQNMPVDNVIVDQNRSVNNETHVEVIRPGGAIPINVPTVAPAEQVMQQVVDQHITDLLNPTENTGETSQYQQVGRPLDLKVSESLKQKIWSNQYIELSQLLDTTSQSTQSLEVVQGQGQSLRLIPSKQTRTINNLGQWCDAFLVFITVYTRKFPEAISDLTNYMHQIKVLQHRGGDYIMYDREYRFMRQANPNLSWQIDPSLWMECRDAKPSQVNKPNNQGRGNRNGGNFRGYNSNKKSHPQGFCYLFHSKGECNRQHCTFKHSCYNQGCGGEHPVFLCKRRDSQVYNSAGPSGTASGAKHSSK